MHDVRCLELLLGALDERTHEEDFRLRHGGVGKALALLEVA